MSESYNHRRDHVRVNPLMSPAHSQDWKPDTVKSKIAYARKKYDAAVKLLNSTGAGDNKILNLIPEFARNPRRPMQSVSYPELEKGSSPEVSDNDANDYY
ncbi:hypothetical protein BGZ65_009189 [Modicella reniformis]|uniref:Uncharacterized protein n=1 Tax=Modicella reniformis TaxID=1440133 RepID=A0A9P6IIZ8_9FUNG|nr:hypothetical protein BGZ65_009189 [Modicella reniformis]